MQTTQLNDGKCSKCDCTTFKFGQPTITILKDANMTPCACNHVYKDHALNTVIDYSKNGPVPLEKRVRTVRYKP